MSPQLKTYAQMDVEIDHGSGCHIITTDGTRYLDLYAGHAVATTGHSHPHVVKAIADQSAKLLFYSNLAKIPIRDEAAELLLSFAPEEITHAFFANSGAEANENALLLARRHTGRKKVIAMEGGFHGRTAGAVSVTGIAKYRDADSPDVVFAPFGEIPPVDGETAAVILEPIQSMAGVKTAPLGYFEKLRALCDKHGTVLIFDEVQTGIGRTGTMFFANRVSPHIITLAKGIASGIPMGAVLTNADIAAKVEYGQYGSTFGAGPVAMAAMKATLEVIRDEKLLDNVNRVGEKIKSALKDVRGEGFLLGIPTGCDSKKIHEEMLKKGIIIGASLEPGVLRLLPPLTLTESQADEFLTAFKEVLTRELQGA